MLADRVLVLNGDALTDIDLTAEVAQHERTGAVATLALVAVEDTASYGSVPTAADGQVEAFLEKTPSPPTNRINAGAYVLEREVVERIPAGRPVSFETEVFPSLVGDGLYGYAVGESAYWIDIGTPERYLEATHDLLAQRVKSTLPPADETGSLVYEGCITSGARIGPKSVLGRHCSVGHGSTVERSVLHDDVRVGSDCRLTGAIVGEAARIGAGAIVEEGAVIGGGAQIEEGAVIASGARIEPAERVG
jgi:mannose-1-phosphate guanylyltransferase